MTRLTYRGKDWPDSRPDKVEFISVAEVREVIRELALEGSAVIKEETMPEPKHADKPERRFNPVIR